MNEWEAVEWVREFLPEHYIKCIRKIEPEQLANKYKDDYVPAGLCWNIKITLFPSVYYPDGGAAVLCKWINNAFYFPELKLGGILEPDREELYAVVARKLDTLFPAATFGCCGSYLACSGQGRCLHPNPFYAAACRYKRNLEQGRVFYGVNQNV